MADARKWLTVLIFAAATLIASSARAAELVLFWRDGCPYCAAWERDIGPIYSKTEMAALAPLRRVALGRESPGVSLKSPVIFTPTFVLVDQGREVGRIEGYPGEEFFWALLSRLLRQLPARDGWTAPDIVRPIALHRDKWSSASQRTVRAAMPNAD